MIGIMGNEFFGKRIVKALNGKIDSVFLYTSLHDLRFRKKIEKIDIIHFIGSPTVSLHGVLTLLRLKLWGKKIIIHWVGADSWLATNKILPKIYTKILKNKIDKHIAIEKTLSNRIKNIGINNIIHPLPVAIHYSIQPLPKEKRILVYAPDNTEYYWKRFNGEIIKKIVKEFKDIEFIILRNSGKHFTESNVTCYNWIDDMKEIYQKVVGVIRISNHDGQPGTIIEALSMGRQFIYSQPFPFCKTATNFEELKIVLNKVIEKPKLNTDGAKYVNEEYNIDKIANGLVKIYQNI